MADARLAEALALEEDGARRIAEIMGQSSAAAAALRELEARRASGENAVIFRHGSRWVVTALLESNAQSGGDHG